MSMSTSRRALSSQPGVVVVRNMPISARCRSRPALRLRSKITVCDRALDRPGERRVNEASRAFEQAVRAAGDGIHRWNDEQFANHVIDE